MCNDEAEWTLTEKKFRLIDALLTEEPLLAKALPIGLIQLGTEQISELVSPTEATTLLRYFEQEAMKPGSDGPDLLEWFWAIDEAISAVKRRT